MRVEFKDPDGVAHHALLVGPREMNHGQKMRVQALLDLYQDETVHPFNVGAKILEKLIAEVVKSWTLDLPVPHGDPALLDEVPDWAYEVLVENVEEHRNRLDFIRTRSTSSESKTSSEDTTSPDKSPQTTP